MGKEPGPSLAHSLSPRQREGPEENEPSFRTFLQHHLYNDGPNTLAARNRERIEEVVVVRHIGLCGFVKLHVREDANNEQRKQHIELAVSKAGGQ